MPSINKIVFVFLLLSPVMGFSQQYLTAETAKGKAKDFYQLGDNDLQLGRLAGADSFLHMAVKEKDNFIDAWAEIGQMDLEYLHRYDEAAQAFEKVKLLDKDYMRDVDFQLAKCYLNQGIYDKAKGHVVDFMKLDKLPAKQHFEAEQMLSDCDFAMEAVKHPVDFKPVNLGPGVNTPDDESMPSLTADGRYLYFTRHTGSGRMQDEDIWVSENIGGHFSQAIPLSINTEQYVEGAQSISPSGKYLFFTSGDRPDGVGRADIYMSRKTGDVWENPYNMGAPINSPGWDAQPCISADGRTLYFSSVRQGTNGSADIFVSYYDDKTGWSAPQSLGDSINTAFDEMRPFVHPDGQTLYFSSNGWPGMGGFDIFMSRRGADGKWGKAINMGYPINTPGDELGIYVTTDGSKAYYASEQKDSYGQKDIYSFDMPTEFRPGYTTYIKGNVFENQSKEPVQANVQVYDVETGKLYTTFSSDKVNGTFLSTLPTGKNYAVEVQKDGYLFYSKNISLKDVKQGEPFLVNIALNRLQVGQSVVLNNIFFPVDKYELKPQSEAELGVIIKLMEKNPGLKIEIQGHTDNTGSEEKNRALSEARAKSVYSYLIEKGIDAERLSYKGYASSKPIADNTSEAGRSKNRRTEFVVTAI